MVEQLKDAVASSVENTTSAMADTNPFLAVTLLAVLAFSVWTAYLNHNYQEELLMIKLKDQEIAQQRVVQIDGFTELLTELRKDNDSDRTLFRNLMDKMMQEDQKRFAAGSEFVEDINRGIQNFASQINEKLDLIINNQQIRSVIRSQPQGVNP